MRCKRLSSWLLTVAALALVLSACSGNSGPTGGSGLPLPSQSRAAVPALAQLAVRRHSQSGKIQHVVIIVQENRSFNNLFYGFPGAKTATYGYNTANQRIKLKPVPFEIAWDIEHDSSGFLAACNGTGSIPGTDCQMNGFDNEYSYCGQDHEPACPNKNPPYSYVPHSETRPYFDLGKQYVLADQMYASNFDTSSFISHQYIIAAQAEASVNYPYGPWGCEGGSGETIDKIGPDRQIPYGYEHPCFTDTTLGQEADNASPPVTWAYYAVSYASKDPGLWSAYQANQYVYYGSDWNKDVKSPPSSFLSDVSKGKLRQISWVTPTWGNSDHAGSRSNTGPAWVASLVNAVGESKYWNNTAIFIFWDDYGGWYDPEPPAYVDYDGLGIRIPMLVVSAYARKSHVSHVHYEHGSILKFVEDTFGLGRLSASDTRATSPEKDCFDFSKPPRPFKVIPTVLGKDYFLHEAPDHHIPDAQ